MEFEERVVNGVLCFRLLPESEFTPYSPEQFTIMLLCSRKREHHSPLMVDGSKINPLATMPEPVQFSDPIDPYMHPATCEER